jgi:hypothetical protein
VRPCIYYMKPHWRIPTPAAKKLLIGLSGLLITVSLLYAQPWEVRTRPFPYYEGFVALAASTNTLTVVGASTTSFIYVSTDGAITWRPSSVQGHRCQAVACSADGRKLVAAADLIYISNDVGTNWTATSAPSASWRAVTCSADGSKLVAVSDRIYTSGDGGVTWVLTGAPAADWTALATSADGARLAAVTRGINMETNINALHGALYISSDSGASWTRSTAPDVGWSCVASSVDGTRLLAGALPRRVKGPDGRYSFVGPGPIYLSVDAGASWEPTSAPSNTWASVASSADGSRLFAAGRDSWLYISSDSGRTWTQGYSPYQDWSCVVCSANGRAVLSSGGNWICGLPYRGPWQVTGLPADFSWALAASADGSRLVTAAHQVDVSTDSGATWRTAMLPADLDWPAVACSADGTTMVAAANGGGASGFIGPIYVSTNSGVAWWKTPAPVSEWVALTASANGRLLVAATSGDQGGVGQIFTSTDLGNSWSPTSAPNFWWTSLAASADGTRLLAGAYASGPLPGNVNSGGVYQSADGGASWSPAAVPQVPWLSVASSADGTRLFAAAGWTTSTDSDGFLYASTNSGATWAPSGAPRAYWCSVACSADGTRLAGVAIIAANSTQRIVYTSTDLGTTWTATDSPAGYWRAVACTADGNNILTLGDDFLGILRPAWPPQPALAVSRSGVGLGLSWMMPSARFVLQQNSALSPADWQEVPNAPTLNLTNLHYEITVTPGPGKSFYRLNQP